MIDIDKFKKINPYNWTVAILDYNRKDELLRCIQTICETGLNEVTSIFLYSNGGDQDTAINLYKSGFINRLILSKENEGCNAGTIQLINSISTEYFIFLESDNAIRFDKNALEKIQEKLNCNDVGCIDLTGMGHFSQRAFAMKTSLYKRVKISPVGGPGPFEIGGDEWSEGEMQKHLRDNNLRVVSVNLVENNGKFTVRQLPCGGILKIRCDTHAVYIVEKPKNKYEGFFGLSDKEWDTILTDQWVDGSIPVSRIAESRKLWAD
jgi:hypothetical protein